MMSTPDALLLVAVCAVVLGFVLVCTTGGFPGDLAQRVARRMKVALRGSQVAMRYRVDYDLIYDGGGAAWSKEYRTLTGAQIARQWNLKVSSWGGTAKLHDQAAEKRFSPPARELETSSFEAYTHCGGCGKLDYHPMREPRPEMTDEEFQRAWKLDYCLQFSIPVGRRGVAAWLEHTFDVIRECSCGHSWGQR